MFAVREAERAPSSSFGVSNGKNSPRLSQGFALFWGQRKNSAPHRGIDEAHSGAGVLIAHLPARCQPRVYRREQGPLQPASPVRTV
jgi:hypothetical protein